MSLPEIYFTFEPDIELMKNKLFSLVSFRRFLLLKMLAAISVVGVGSCQQQMKESLSSDIRDTTHRDSSSAGKISVNEDTIKAMPKKKLKKKVKVPKADTTYRVNEPVLDYGVIPYHPEINQLNN